MRSCIRPVSAGTAQGFAGENAPWKWTSLTRTLLRRKPAHHGLTVGLTGPQNALGKIGMIQKLRKILRLETKTAVPAVNRAVLAINRALQKITGIKLQTRLVAQDFQHPAADRLMYT